MPWQPNSFDPDPNTLDFWFKPTPEILEFLANLEAEVLSQVSNDSELYFGARMAPEKVRASFQSNLKKSQKLGWSISHARGAIRLSDFGTSTQSP